MKPPRKSRGFSLVELLTVIAIIAILAAIIFPVMATVKERARQNQCITNLHQIAQAIQLFKQDNRRYPDILGAPARLPTTGTGLGPIWKPGDPKPEMFENVKDAYLFPEYIKTIAGFHCPSSKISNSSDVVVHYKVRGSTKQEDYLPVYAYDSYNTMVFGSGADAGGYSVYSETDGTAEPHYLLVWAPTVGDVAGFSPYPPGQADTPRLQQQDYERQLRWRNPPGDTVVTWCSWHQGPDFGGRCPVVFLDGHADIMPAKELRDCKWRTRPKKS